MEKQVVIKKDKNQTRTFQLERVGGAACFVGDEDTDSFELYSGKHKRVALFAKNIGEYSMKFFKLNNKTKPTCNQIVQGL